MNILIKNIFYMLCYAWDMFEEKSLKDLENKFGDEKFDNIYNLMAKILTILLPNLIKRGFYKNYIIIEEDLSMLKGKIDFSKSIKTNIINQRKLICRYDTLSANILLNQIIKTTLHKLINYKDIDGENLRSELISLSRYFAHIKNININNNTFKSLKFHRNNIYYKLIINICKFVHKNLISDKSGEGNNIFIDENEEQTMSKLYEKFVLNFYKHHFRNNNNIEVSSPNIEWQIDKKDEYIPIMKTDITINNKAEDKCLIIDTKFYKSILSKSNYSGENNKIIANHLYQIYAYINNTKVAKNVKGILLYALPSETDKIEKDYTINDMQNKKFEIGIRTLDLNIDWKDIETQLECIVDSYF